MAKTQEAPSPETSEAVAQAPDIEALARKRVAESFGALDIETARQVVKDQLASDAKAAKKAAK